MRFKCLHVEEPHFDDLAALVNFEHFQVDEDATALWEVNLSY